MIQRGEVWWADLPAPHAGEPGFRRPLLVVQNDAFNRSRIQTIVAVVITSNLRLLEAPGNVLLPARRAGLPKDSVVNVSQVATVGRELFSERAGKVSPDVLNAVEKGMRLVLDL